MPFPIVAAIGLGTAIVGLIGSKKQAKAAKDIAKQQKAADEAKAKAAVETAKLAKETELAKAKAKANGTANGTAFDWKPLAIIGGAIVLGLVGIAVLKR